MTTQEAVRIERLADHMDWVPTLAAWHHAQWGALNPAFTLEARTERLRARATCRGIPTAVVALVGEGLALAGSASLVESDMDTHPEITPWLASVYVSPEFRNRGVGSTLVGEIERIAAEEGVKTLWLWTPDRDRLYARLGWTTVAREPYRGLEAVIMRKGI
jgi:GNAT superfamily N-acetyltransferase